MRLPNRWREQVIAEGLNAGHEARSAWPSRGIAEEVTTAVGSIEVPVLVLAGEHDRVDPPASPAEHLLPLIPAACLKVVGRTDTCHRWKSRR